MFKTNHIWHIMYSCLISRKLVRETIQTWSPTYFWEPDTIVKGLQTLMKISFSLKKLWISIFSLGIFFQDLNNLIQLRNLHTLSLKDPVYGANPVATVCNYSTYVFYHLPQIKRLDGYDVDNEAFKSLAMVCGTVQLDRKIPGFKLALDRKQTKSFHEFSWDSLFMNLVFTTDSSQNQMFFTTFNTKWNVFSPYSTRNQMFYHQIQHNIKCFITIFNTISNVSSPDSSQNQILYH